MVRDKNGHEILDRRIDEIRMCQSDRAIAKARMHDADAVAGIFCSAIEKLFGARSSRRHPREARPK